MGRREITSESDDDFMVLFEGATRAGARPSLEDAAEALGAKPPGREGAFAQQVWLDHLRERSSATGGRSRSISKARCALAREKAGVRNAKLRLSRKALFAGGLLPVLECYRHPAADMLDFLEERMSIPPLDRIADAFVAHRALDPGVRVLTASDELLGILDDAAKRRELTELALTDRQESPLFVRVAELGKEFEASLLALLFDDPKLRRWVREYLIF